MNCLLPKFLLFLLINSDRFDSHPSIVHASFIKCGLGGLCPQAFSLLSDHGWQALEKTSYLRLPSQLLDPIRSTSGVASPDCKEVSAIFGQK